MEDQDASTNQVAPDATKPVFVTTRGANHPKSWQTFTRVMQSKVTSRVAEAAIPKTFVSGTTGPLQLAGRSKPSILDHR